ncbi:MAG: Ig-like domain-containing protein [Myxococcales bacterium]|nr:Ig-like domain-containing protein [Myxococcales bacterium]
MPTTTPPNTTPRPRLVHHRIVHSLGHRLVAATIAAAMIAGCNSKTTSRPVTAGAGTGAGEMAYVASDKPGMVIRLSDGTLGAEAGEAIARPAAAKLSDRDTEALLARTKPIVTDAADVQAFALRQGPVPPPRTGETIKTAFPPPPSSATAPVVETGALSVVRFAPQGEVPVAPNLTVTFSQPMVAITSQDDAAKTVPVTLTPTPAGKWRWLGTKTLMFDPDVRFPMSTTYKVEIPAGTKSATGGVLAKAEGFSFTTPTLAIETYYVGRPSRRDEGVFLQFNQKIDQRAMLEYLGFKASGGGFANAGGAIAAQLMTDEEIAKHETIAAMVAQAKDAKKDGWWIAVRPAEILPAATSIAIVVKAGARGAEGPNKTPSDLSESYETFHALKLEEAQCGWRDDCRPGMQFSFRFNNQLDEELFDESWVTVSPAIDDLKIVASYRHVTLQGITKPNTKYTVKISGKLRDQFEQTLGSDIEKTFSVGKSSPTFYGADGMIVLDPVAKTPTFGVFTSNYRQVKVRLWKVEPKDYNAFLKASQERWRSGTKDFPGTALPEFAVDVRGDIDQLKETPIDLSRALKGGLGHVIVYAEPSPWTETYPAPAAVAWVQSTKLALDAAVDQDVMSAWVTKLQDGSPVSGVALRLMPSGVAATTGADGMAKITLPAAAPGKDYVVAQSGADTAFIASGDYWNDYATWVKRSRGSSIQWYLADDRQMYRPGEEVKIKGWLRRVGYDKGGDVAGIDGALSTISYTAHDSTGNEIAKGTGTISPLGGFDVGFTLPKTPNLGHAYVQFSASGRESSSAQHSFQIQEFRRPEYEVSASASAGPHILASSSTATVKASYYAGGGLVNAETNWYVTAQQSSYTPPNRDEYSFGKWVPWWGFYGYEGHTRGYGGRSRPTGETASWNHKGTTNASGEHTLKLDFVSANPALPYSVTAAANVTDVNRQSWGASTSLLVHPSSLYVGLKTKRTFLEKGQPIELDVIGVDIDGKFAPGRTFDVKAVRLDWTYKKGKYEEVEKDAQSCSVTTKDGASACSFTTKNGGQYRISAVITDDRGRPSLTELTVWVSGGSVIPAREVEQEQVQLIPDKKEYAAGDTVKILVQAPFYPAEGVLSIRRSGLVDVRRFTMKEATTTLSIPVVEGYVPNFYATVDLVGAAPRLGDDGQPKADLPKRPAFARGELNLTISKKQRTLGVKVTPAASKVSPGDKATFAVHVTDAAGKSVPAAEVALMVVDESVLALSGYTHPNPLDTFYTGRDSGVADTYLRAWVKLAKPDVGALAQSGAEADAMKTMERSDMAVGGAIAETMDRRPSAAAPPAPGLAAKNEAPKRQRQEDRLEKVSDGFFDSENSPQTAIAVRTDFNPLAAFSPTLQTDASGKATLTVKMPDNLTRYRVVAIAVAGGKQFGKGESNLTARLPLMVRPSAPRFLNFGDRFEMPVVLQNQTDAAMTVKLAMRSTNAKLTDGGGRQVTVPANDRVEVRFPMEAQMAGTARMQIVGAAGSASDAAELSLPVWTPATTEAFATYGVIDKGAITQPVALPGKVVTQFGGLEVETSSTQLQALTDAFIYLVTYPFECSEQMASRMLSIVALRDVLTEFKAEGLPRKAELEARIARDLELLASIQNSEGGFPFWRRGYESWPYNTVHVANALVRAKLKGYAVPAGMLDRTMRYLKDIERYYPHYYGPQIRWTISSYALYIRMLNGDRDVAKAKGILREAGKLENMSMESIGWLLGVFAAQRDAATEQASLIKFLGNRVSETAGAANFTTSYSDGGYLLLASERRVDGVILESLIAAQKDSELIPKLVMGLLAHQKKGRWGNTQENSLILLALDKYFHTYENITPNFVARAWLADQYAGEMAFRGRETKRHQFMVPMLAVSELGGGTGKGNLILQKDGAGRMYYRIGMRYAPADLKLFPADYGFTVLRSYEGADNAGDVVHEADGTWTMKAGARIRVRLTMVAENRRYHVALVDPLPAGLEAMNPALAVTGPIPQDAAAGASSKGGGGGYWWWSRTWYEHQNMRDERVEAFTSLLWDGVHEYTYVARATTPGRFIVPPTKAEEMYSPETFGRSGSDIVTVK